MVISIHAPRMGSDGQIIDLHVFKTGFQSTLPGWGATVLRDVHLMVSAHFNPRSPDGERLMPPNSGGSPTNFNPRSPDGERPSIGRPYPRSLIYFNPRSPDGERLQRGFRGFRRLFISIHAPRMGSDVMVVMTRLTNAEFQSTLPGWGATRSRPSTRHRPYFNPRSPDGERPRKWTSSPTIWAKSSIFNTDCIADRR